MPPRDPNLPEGTDSIIDDDVEFGSSSGAGMGGTAGAYGDVGDTLGSSASGVGTSGTYTSSSNIGSEATKAAGAVADKVDVQSLKAQATEKVRDAASQGKDKASDALDQVSRLVSETADTVDDRLGPQYGNYVRKAGEALDGLNDSLRGKQVDELFDDARDLVRRSPAVAIGAAAAIGFLLVRLVKSGMPQTIDQDDDYYTSGSRSLPGTPPRVDSSYDPVA